jgi:hypothetical protein
MHVMLAHAHMDRAKHSLAPLCLIPAKKFMLLSVATALASRVFEHPGGPYSNTPRGRDSSGGAVASRAAAVVVEGTDDDVTGVNREAYSSGHSTTYICLCRSQIQQVRVCDEEERASECVIKD